jgi:hypothetical protein
LKVSRDGLQCPVDDSIELLDHLEPAILCKSEVVAAAGTCHDLEPELRYTSAAASPPKEFTNDAIEESEWDGTMPELLWNDPPPGTIPMSVRCWGKFCV